MRSSAKFYFFIILIFTISFVHSETFELGGMYTQHYRDGRYAEWGKYSRLGAQIAIEEINESNMLDGDKISMPPENIIDYHCWTENTNLMASTLMKKKIIALTGAECSDPAVIMAELGAVNKIPVISYGANAALLSSPEEFPWFVRVVAPSESYEKYLIDLAAHFNVKEIAYFHTTDAWGEGAYNVIKEAVFKHNINISRVYSFPRDEKQSVLDSYIKEIKEENIKHIVITTPTPDTVNIFRSINKLGLNKVGYSFYASEMILNNESIEVTSGAFGYFAPIAKLSDSLHLRRYSKSFEKSANEKVDLNSSNFIYSALSYDHIFVIAHAIKLTKLNKLKVNRENTLKFLRKVDFDGATGRISFESSSNDRLNMPMQIMNNQGIKDNGEVVFVSIAEIDQSTGNLDVQESKILWPGNTKQSPK
tara:strand:- start:6291 stop:7553 length:1263 start_codon:yes stop_codon:yes gene_type:complete